MKEKRILLIENNEDHAKLISSILKEDSQEAIDYFQYEMQSQVSLIKF